MKDWGRADKRETWPNLNNIFSLILSSSSLSLLFIYRRYEPLEVYFHDFCFIHSVRERAALEDWIVRCSTSVRVQEKEERIKDH